MESALHRIAGLFAVPAWIACTLFVSACNRHPATSSSGLLVNGSGSAKVSYRPEVRVMEEAEGRASISGVDSTGAALLFDSANAIARSLKKNDILVIKGLIARKVLAAEAGPDGI